VSDIGAKDELLATLRAERERWEGLLAEVGVERFTTPGVCGEWSVKDLLGHLTAFHRVWGAQLKGEMTDVPPTMRDLFDRDSLPEGAEKWTGDEQNAAIHAHYAPLAPALVLGKWREATDMLIGAVESMSDADVATPGRFGRTGDRALATAIEGDTFGHSRFHAAQVRAWLDGRQGQDRGNEEGA
jgi:uncharacterized protein (TIGR03083 family)